MKTQKVISFNASGDVVKVNIDVICADIEIVRSENPRFSVQKLKHSHIKITEHNGVLKIKQTRKPRFHRAAAKICVPAHCVPDISADVRCGKLDISGGVYGDLILRCENAQATFNSAKFADAEIKGRLISLYCGDVSARRSFNALVSEGNILMEKASFPELDCTLRNGDIGITELKCKDSSFTVDKGSISLSLDGTEDDYSLSLLSKNGLCSRANSRNGGNVVKAYINRGNIVVDFTVTKEIEENGHDFIPEDTRVALVS